MTKPNPVQYEINGYQVVLSDPGQLTTTADGHPAIDGGYVQYQGKRTQLLVRYDNKPDLGTKVAAWKAGWEEYKAAEAQKMAINVPGLEELRAALFDLEVADDRYQDRFASMMDDEHNDGTRPPTPPRAELHEQAARLTKEYPRAALYLKAQRYTTHSGNADKYRAGMEAMEKIADGDDLSEAKRVLDDWLPESAMWN